MAKELSGRSGAGRAVRLDVLRAVLDDPRQAVRHSLNACLGPPDTRSQDDGERPNDSQNRTYDDHDSTGSDTTSRPSVLFRTPDLSCLAPRYRSEREDSARSLEVHAS